MASLNKVQLIGNLTRDPEIKFTAKGTAIGELGMAINRVWYNDNKEKQEDATFIDVTLWGKTAETAGKYLTKGSSVYIEGRLQLDTWDDKETGKKRSKLKVVGDSMQFLDSKKGGDQSQSRPQQKSLPPAPAADNGDDDSIPF